jgi:chromosome segregation ATPase
VNQSFAPIGQSQLHHAGENSFWPSFTDVMMVITMIFLMATSLLVVRNWQLVAELQESIAAEQLASDLMESTTQENATLEERVANAEQSNSILRLRLLKKTEELSATKNTLDQFELGLNRYKAESDGMRAEMENLQAALDIANLELDAALVENQNLSERNAEQNFANEQVALKLQSDLSRALAEVESLAASSQSQQENISNLNLEKRLLAEEIDKFNKQLLTLKGEYEVVRSKYEELIKPARSAKGKYIAEVFYIKKGETEIIRYKQPGDADFIDLSLQDIEVRLAELKAIKGNDLYVKIIIPKDSGLTYNEAWGFMRNLLVKFDYYYQ